MVRNGLVQCSAWASLGLALALSACSTSYEVIPAHLEDRIQKHLSIDQVRQKPDAFKGRIVMWGGRVLSASRTAGQARIELLELPLDSFFRPLDAPTASRDRYLAVAGGEVIKDPSGVKADTLVTIIGELLDPVKAALDKDTYEYPTLAIMDMTAWERQSGLRHTAPGSPLVGFRPYIFWDSRRVVDGQ